MGQGADAPPINHIQNAALPPSTPRPCPPLVNVAQNARKVGIFIKTAPTTSVRGVTAGALGTLCLTAPQ